MVSLLVAAMCGYEAEAMLLLEKGADVKAKVGFRVTSLH
jgi:hypothetical protein